MFITHKSLITTTRFLFVYHVNTIRTVESVSTIVKESRDTLQDIQSTYFSME